MRPPRGPRLMVVMAHPDDEVLWASAAIADADVALVHLTDGSPADPFFARSAGCEDAREYASLRRRELKKALEILGLANAPLFMLGARDQEAALHLAELSRALAALVETRRPDALIAHAYDGGHPDHDAAAFVARAAIALCARVPRPFLLDAAGGKLEVGFLPRKENRHAHTFTLGAEARARKERALACFLSQRAVIDRLDWTVERLRPGARERFAAPPHPGPLHYETHGWAIDGALFRAQACAAALALGLPEMLA